MAPILDRSLPDKLFNEGQEAILNEFKEFLRFPSISADPNYSQGCEDCVAWLARYVERIGFKAEVLKTSSKPVLFAERKGKPGAPTLLYYGHYDVQPVDPLNLWDSPPFEPTLRNGRIYARGALDNKGQTMAFLKGVEFLTKQGGLNANLKLVIEGEEECGSEALWENMAQWRERLKADVLLVCDTEAQSATVPAITMGLRGIVHLAVRISGPTCDLHSGVHGGVAPNPATAIARLVASFHNPDGSIAIEGFYDSVSPVTPELKKLVAKTPLDVPQYEKDFGIPPVGGEQRYSIEERRGLRPTVEINGIHSGYGGPGSKTIIPAIAEAKVTSRIVSGQDPEKILGLMEAHIKKHAPRGLKTEVYERSVGGEALSLNPNSPLVDRALKVLRPLHKTEPALLWVGPSVPIVAELGRTAGAEPLLVGFGLAEDRIHAPNESTSIHQFKDGFAYSMMILSSW